MARSIVLRLVKSKVYGLNLECFLRDCFPDLFHVLQTSFTRIFLLVVQATDTNKCNEFNLVLTGKYIDWSLGHGSGISFRNPSLLPIQLVGMLMGLIIGFSIDRNDGMSLSYAYAFLNFAGMNIASILAHSLTEPHSALWKLSIDVDVAFTGASSICLVLAALNSRQIVKTPRSIICLIAPTCIAVMLLNSLIVHLPFVAEFMYLGNVHLSVIVLFWHYTASYSSHAEYLSNMFIGFAGICIAGTGIFFEDAFCRITTGAYTSVSAVFLGCCVAFLSVFKFAFQIESKKIKSKEI